ncbi:fungal-specific transcription factor domain-containing protein [Aspergillus oleicola]
MAFNATSAFEKVIDGPGPEDLGQRSEEVARAQQPPAKKVKRGNALCHSRKIKVRPEFDMLGLASWLTPILSATAIYRADNALLRGLIVDGGIFDQSIACRHPSRWMSQLDTPPDDTAPFVGETSMAHTLREVENRFKKTQTNDRTNTFFPPHQAFSPVLDSSAKEGRSQDDKPGRIHHALKKHDVILNRPKWDRYLQVFIEEIHVLYPFLHLPTLHENHDHFWDDGCNEQRASYSAADYIQVTQVLISLAIGRCTSASRADSEEIQHCSGWSLYTAAMDILGGEAGLFTINGNPLIFLQTMALVVIYLLRLDANERASKVIAMLISHSHQLGLHRNSVLSQMPIFESEMYRRLWWCIYMLDRQVSLETGLPFSIQDMNVDTGLPLELSDDRLSRYRDPSEMSNATKADADAELSSQPATPIPYLACMVSYSKVIGKIWEALYKAREGRRADMSSDGLIQEYLEHLISSAERETVSSLVYDIRKSFSEQVEGLECWQVKQKALLHMRWTFLRLCIRRPMLKRASSFSGFASSLNSIDNELKCMKLVQSIFHQFYALYDRYPKFEFPFPHYLARTTMISLGLIIKEPSFHQGYGDETLQMARLIKSLCRQTWVSGKFVRSVVALNKMAETVLGGSTATASPGDDMHLEHSRIFSEHEPTAICEFHESAFASANTSQVSEPQANAPQSTPPAPIIPALPSASSDMQVSEEPAILSPNFLDLVTQDFEFERTFNGGDTRLDTHFSNFSAAPYPQPQPGSSSSGTVHDNGIPEAPGDRSAIDAECQTVDNQPDLQALNMDWVQGLLGAGFHADPFNLW